MLMRNTGSVKQINHFLRVRTSAFGTTFLAASLTAALAIAAVTAREAQAYPLYNDGFGIGCVQCHSGFSGGPQHLLHAVHTSKFGITTCNACHPNGGGSKPVRTYRSGTGGALGCAGCHGLDYGEASALDSQPKASGYGLRQAHANAGVTVCQDCHYAGNLGSPDPLPAILPESELPPYYGTAVTNLYNPCESAQEDNTFDIDLLGLDNDGDGARDWPNDPDCAVPTSTTTTTTTTTTTLPVECGAAPAQGCFAPTSASLLVSEKTVGKEKVKVALKKLQPTITQSQFGNPVTGTTSYALCIYDALDQLVAQMSVARGSNTCGGSPPKPCWAAVSEKGYKYNDKTTSADGILKMLLKGGDAGSGKIVVAGKNNATALQTSLPTGVAAALQDDSQATVQLLTSDSVCFSMTLPQLKTADGLVFSATGP